jgi:hypothetical protein
VHRSREPLSYSRSRRSKESLSYVYQSKDQSKKSGGWRRRPSMP